MERENFLVSARIGWATSLSTGLLGTEGILTLVIFTSQHQDSIRDIGLISLQLVLSICGIYFCIYTRIGINAAHSQLHYLKDQYTIHAQAFERMHLPRPFGDSRDHQSGNVAALVFPNMMITVWAIFVILQLGFVGYLIGRLVMARH